MASWMKGEPEPADGQEKPQSSTAAMARRLTEPYDQKVLVLQGGGALGAYQAGVLQGILEADSAPNWVAGVSIGAINAALVVGNPPERRLERLRTFWDLLSSGVPVGVSPPATPALAPLRSWFNHASAAASLLFGVPGFFAPRLPPVLAMPADWPGPLGIYDTTQLRETLEQLVDFERINRREVRFSIGAVNVRSGNSIYFDNLQTTIDVRHVMASAALPPGFDPVEIDHECYWDGGIVSNTPLWYVLDHRGVGDTLVLQVDLYSARGDMPTNIHEVMERQKDIQYSSKTRFNTAFVQERQEHLDALQRLLAKLPPALRSDADVKLVEGALRARGRIDIFQLINRRFPHSSHNKDYEFSRATVHQLWEAGLQDVRRTIADPQWTRGPDLDAGVHVYDLSR